MDPDMTEPSRVAPIELAVETTADVPTAWLAISDPSRVAEWFTEASPLGAIGSVYSLDFGDGSVVTGRILEIETGVRFVHTWRWEGSEERETTRVAWSVTATPGGSRITLVHDGWTEAGLDETVRDDHAGYWTGYLEDLRDVLAGA
jgi:uncharacterized protein YndB with AHSA1/START domain